MSLDFDGASGKSLGGLVFVIQYLFPKDIVPYAFEDNGLGIPICDGVEDQCARDEHNDDGVSVAYGFALVVGGKLIVVPDDVRFVKLQKVIVCVSIAGFHFMFENALVLVVE